MNPYLELITMIMAGMAGIVVILVLFIVAVFLIGLAKDVFIDHILP